MLVHNIDPVAFHIGPLKVYWYGLSYFLSVMIVWRLGLYRAKQGLVDLSKDQVTKLIFLYWFLPLIVGARLGEYLFYRMDVLLHSPWQVFELWKGGMSFHGGLLAVMISYGLFSRCYQKSYWMLADFSVCLAPIGLALGRLANFINGELWGRVTRVPWGVVFPKAGYTIRHPSQLYEFMLEGVVLFVILWVYASKPRARGTVFALFLFLYGAFRFIVEFYRQPDAVSVVPGLAWMSRGQELCALMMLAGLVMFWWFGRRDRVGPAS